MYHLTRVHRDTFGWAFRCRDPEANRTAILTVTVKGQITTDNFVEYKHLQSVDPDPATTIINLNDSALWVHMNFNGSVIATRLIEVDVHLHDETASAVKEAMAVLNRIAERAGHYRRSTWTNNSSAG